MFKFEFDNDLNIKCDEVWNVPNAVKKIEKSIIDSGLSKKCTCGKRGYKYFIIETVDNAKCKSDLTFLKNKLVEAYQKSGKTTGQDV